MEGLTLDDLKMIRHMVGATSQYKTRDWGFRNYYATSGGRAMAALDRLVTLGYIVKGSSSPNMHYYHATENGCIAAGLNAQQIKRALEDN
jgi:hypothetical protein